MIIISDKSSGFEEFYFDEQKNGNHDCNYSKEVVALFF
jgi:hypothetical protein